jgi:pyroglutamyl-peptidase
VPAATLLAAVRTAGLRATLSRDAGSYLCNYLCWRAIEVAERPDGPRLAAFVHVPEVKQGVQSNGRQKGLRAPRTLEDLVVAGEAIVEAVRTAARVRR